MENHFTQQPIPAKSKYSSESHSSSPTLEPVATVALEAGKMLMEAGASAKSVERIVQMVAWGLGAEQVDLRIGYASLAVTIRVDEAGITRMRRIGDLGVNQRLIQELWDLGRRVSNGALTTEHARTELARLEKETPRHSPWVMALATGLACAAFGRLLGVDWQGTGPVFLASTAGQFLRHKFLRSRVNIFLCTAVVSLLSCALAGLGARWVGSETGATAMIASILLLIPGVPAVNALSDILEGHPTLGSARAVTVAVILIFIAAGLWIGNAWLNQWHPT
jgi:uncharacterized membrane protein YjjP (DUF1212 family)